jgi:argininosuccinate lyase
MWGGRFSLAPHEIMEKINASIDFDKKLYREDIWGSKIHCQMLAKQKIISKDDAEKILKGLEQVQREIEEDKFVFSAKLEDIHMNVEFRLKEIIGDAAGKLHTARSRNDQVALDVKLYVRDAIDNLIDLLKKLNEAYLAKAEEYYDVLMAGCTHLQVAQPTTFGHHLMAYYEMFLRDIKRLKNARYVMNECPLGAAALCGTPFPIDRFYTAKELGFDSPTRNSMDSVSDRDFVIELLACVSIIAMHLSRFSEECVIWCSQPYNYIAIPEEYTTGSSIMPQKKNPDSCELIRGKTGRIYGDLNTILTIMKGLPMTYQKDMQEDKEPLFDAVENINICVKVMTEIVKGIIAKKDNMKKILGRGYPNATDLADYLVKKLNIPFREAHHIVGSIVKEAENNDMTLENVPLRTLRKFCKDIKEDVYENIKIETSLNSRNSYGGTASKNVLEMIKFYKGKNNE